MSSTGVASVDQYATSIKKLLAKAKEVKTDGQIEPALSAPDFQGGIEEVGSQSSGIGNRSYAAIETACRNIFYDLLASTVISDPAFAEVWNFFDIVSILSDLEYCEPSLVTWLVEELLDSQTIDGCRLVFDYLESRRERITGKHFDKKKLIILRACNELLRRLSRAEDTVFCGRVFIFLFQSFPLGDRSSVNLRGEYHLENVTVFEDVPSGPRSGHANGMDIDQEVESKPKDESASTAPPAASEEKTKTEKNGPIINVVKDDAQSEKSKDPPLTVDALYTIFWSLQELYSHPTKLFEDTSLQTFKDGLKATIEKFKEVQQEQQARGSSKLPEDSRRGVKRKRNGQEDELASAFNPKYLTSRDLFELEISDLSFRRHILVQSLILVDFLLSLTPKAKRKLDSTSNKSVLYNYTLTEDNTKWATTTRNDIATYLQQGPEGKFYYRMVDTVLSRDKNWVHWKAEGCPPIARDPVSADDFAEAEKSAQKACTNKRLRPTPMGTLNLDFLADRGEDEAMLKLKDSERYTVPTADAFKGPIGEDDFDIEMAKTEEDKQTATEAKASKLWRTLRIASKSKLNVFDKIDDGNNLKPLFEPPEEEVQDKPDDAENKENLADGGEKMQPEGEGDRTSLPDDESKTEAGGETSQSTLVTREDQPEPTVNGVGEIPNDDGKQPLPAQISQEAAVSEMMETVDDTEVT